MPVRLRKMFRFIALAACVGALHAASANDLLDAIKDAIDPNDLSEPGNTKRAEAIADMLNDDVGLAAAEVVELRLALGEAWIGAGKVKEAEDALRPVLTDKNDSAAQRERAGLGWVAIWQLLAAQSDKPAELPTPFDYLAPFGDLGTKVAARAHSAAAEQALAQKVPNDAMKHLDQAIELLKAAPTAERVPLYSMRLLAMEQAKLKPDEIQEWLRNHSSDPATTQVSASALTNGQRLVGQPAPPLKAKRLDGQQGEFDLAAAKGKTSLIYFFATWGKACEATTPAVSTFAAQLPDLVTVGVSIDTADTVANLAPYIAKYGIKYPVIGDGLGWDSEVDDAYYVESLPTIILIGANGIVSSVDTAGATPEETLKNLHAAYDAMTGVTPKKDDPVEAIP